ncbi:MAG: serine/threonine protein kinase [Deltaproteobacteria bacterium]|nr:serine/threonine protein kinase [Deltaproteobacteria bacterium]
MRSLIDELRDPEERKTRTLREELLLALGRFVDQGPDAAYSAAIEVLEEALRRVSMLEQVTHEEEHGRQHAFRALRELDLAVLETDTLESLLALGGGERDQRLGDLFQRLTQWLVLYEGDPILEPGDVPHFTLRLRRLRTLLHLVDADGPNVEERPELLRSRRLLTARVLYSRAKKDARTPLRRALCAAASRAGDALVREDLAEVSDVLLSVGSHLEEQVDLMTMAEASMVPEIDTALRAYARLSQATRDASASGGGLRQALDALLELANDLPVASSPRVEALRAALLDFARALENVASSGSLAELSERSGETPLDSFASAIHTLAHLVRGARRRLGERMRDEEPESPPAVRYLEICLERARSGSRAALEEAADAAKEAVARDLPRAIADVARLTFERLRKLPDDGPRRSFTSFLPAPPKEAPLPAWMPPSRTLGGFRVLRAIGSGAVGSVFVAERAEERHEANAERVALKVPDYSGAAARTLSEEEFLDLFRQEAGALLAVPRNEHLASFVTFDAGARPKPILVMELVEGPTLERFLEKGGFDMSAALDILLGVASGLEAMHGVGVAHLDVKPSNVIMRASGSEADAFSVLVDFGLAGRHLRPGCGTGEYGAPEIWGLGEDQGDAEAAPADVYAFGCLCYEVLTTRTLFSAPTELALITSHVSHDGMPARVGALTSTSGLAEVLRRCLRRNGRERASMPEVRAALDRVAPTLEALSWPLQV